MTLRSPRVLAPVVFLLVSPLFAAEDVKVTAGTVEDQRFSDDRFGGLSIALVLKGSGVADVKAVRVRVKSAKDDVGTVLCASRRRTRSRRTSKNYSESRQPGPEVHLTSPRRDASTVDVAGEVELFIPARDPSTKQRFEQFLGALDKPIASSALKAAKVEITPLSPKDYKSRQEKNKPTKGSRSSPKGRSRAFPDAEIQQALKMMDALGVALGRGRLRRRASSWRRRTRRPDHFAIDVVHGRRRGAPARRAGAAPAAATRSS